MTIGKGYQDRNLSEHEIRDVMEEGLETLDIEGEKVLIIIPDLTRTAPIPLFFRIFYELIGEEAEVLDYLVALGTHPIMSEKALNRRVGITAEERRGKYAGVRIFNHRWDLPDTFVTLGTIPAAEVEELSEGRLSLDVPVRLNRLILDYDQLIIVGPVFPHEVVGFSGGNKYFLPGICGQEVIDATHWLGALMTSMAIIGTKDTPVRRMIDRAASFIDQPKACFSMVVEDEGLAGLYFGSPEEAWSAAADLSSELHIRYLDHPVEKVLSVLPEMYDDMWTGGKGMYKVEPVVADGGEVIIYAPHVTEVSYTWGEIIDQIGYHVRDYFLEQWDRFKDYPWGVLAHSTHVRGVGTYDPDTGEERPRVDVTLATRIPAERCRRINLGYRDPDAIDPEEWKGREEVLMVPKAGEMLYRLRSEKEA